MKISDKRLEKISEQILALLYSINPKPLFTSQIAKEIARDEEFTKTILLDLKLKKLVVEINKNKEGNPYKKRKRWKLTDSVYLAYKNHQTN